VHPSRASPGQAGGDEYGAELPGTVRGRPGEDSDAGSDPAVRGGRAQPGPGAVGAPGDGATGAGDGPSGADGASEGTSAAGDGAHLVGDFARGKRLRKLLRLINNGATAATLAMFRFRMLLMTMTVLAVHVAAFVAVMVVLSDESSYVTNLAAAGGPAGWRSCLGGRGRLSGRQRVGGWGMKRLLGLEPVVSRAQPRWLSLALVRNWPLSGLALPPHLPPWQGRSSGHCTGSAATPASWRPPSAATATAPPT
jgi:hypothetical protein